MGRVELMVSAALLACAVGVNNAAAQDQDPFRRDRNVGVRDRPRPEYDAPGMPAGGFRLYPELDVYQAYNDNIFATDVSPEEDAVTTVQLSGLLQSQWSSHALSLDAGVESQIHAEFDQDDTTDWHAGATGRLDVVRGFYISGLANFAALHEDRSSSPTVVQLKAPVAFDRAEAELGIVRRFNRVGFTAGARAVEHDYEDGELNDGTPVEQDDRDRIVYEANGRLDYAISPDTSLFLNITGNWRDYSVDPPDPAATIARDSSGGDALVGVSFDLTHLIRGELNVGYLTQDYEDPATDSTSGLATRSMIEWFVDPLVTVRVAASREVRDAGVQNAAGYLSSGAEVAVDYELRRNIILGFEAGYSSDEYNAIDREDRRTRFEARADYALNRRVALTFEVGHYEQESRGADPGREYEINRALIGLKLRR